MVVKGVITKISGPVVVAREMKGVKMHEVVKVGEMELVGETIKLEGDHATIQVYEETAGLKPGEPVIGTGHPLSVELGPGIIGQIFDGIQRPLTVLAQKAGAFIERGISASALNRERKWHFIPRIKAGQKIKEGAIIGEVPETSVIMHKVLLPPGINGKVKSVVPEGDYTIEETIAEIENDEGIHEIKMYQVWPVRKPRPYSRRIPPNTPLITGQRIIDMLFPIAKGGTVAIAGGFGMGKTVLQHQLAKWSDANIIVFVGCGERGNEIADVLEEFPDIVDPHTGKSIMERSIIIANTSNMPMAAREASIFTGVTIAEYYRDMGYHVLLQADSTSRWAEALREITGRLEEMPEEEGYPAYLASTIAEFYERAGLVEALNHEVGSVTISGSVSPPGGDFSEPVTQSTLKIVEGFLALDAELAHKRHFPAINWLISYSLVAESLEKWYSKNVAEDYGNVKHEMEEILEQASELEEIVQLVGKESLAESQKELLEISRMIRNNFLLQYAFDPVDKFSTPQRTYLMAKIILRFHSYCRKAVRRGKKVRELLNTNTAARIREMRSIPNEKFESWARKVLRDMVSEFEPIIGGE